jgi:hypothetical protein
MNPGHCRIFRLVVPDGRCAFLMSRLNEAPTALAQPDITLK